MEEMASHQLTDKMSEVQGVVTSKHTLQTLEYNEYI